MASTQKRIEKRRLRSSYITSTISISLFLLLLGVMGLLLLNAKRISDHVKENILFKVVIQDKTKEVEIFQIQKALDAKQYVKETKYITKEDAAYELEQALGEDFIETLGHNPLLPMIEVKFLASYANNDSIEIIEKDLREFSFIKEVYYQKNLIEAVNENIRKITIAMLIFCGFLFLIALALINNTIRLSIYSKRFIIRTMQLVGATHNYIRKPFIWKAVLQGLVGAFVAITFITAIIYFLQHETEGILVFTDLLTILILHGSIIFTGIFIICISTYFSVGKYLRMKTDKLYS